MGVSLTPPSGGHAGLIWRTLGTSVVGSAHVTGGLPCQDAGLIASVRAPDGQSTLVLVAADGAGSAARAEVGAQLACAEFVRLVTPYLAEGNRAGAVSRLVAEDWCWQLGEAIRRHAEMDGTPVREFACTLVAALVDDAGVAGLQVGDGAIVVRDDMGYRPLFWPQRGEYANMTHFLTEFDATDRLAFAVLPEPVDEVAVLTDGLQSLALHYATNSAHAPFFENMFRPLRAAAPDQAAALGEPLAAYFASEAITRRTDDDKTLLLATRCAPDEAPQPAPIAPATEVSAADVA